MGRTTRAFIILPHFLLYLGMLSAIPCLRKIERLVVPHGDPGDNQGPVESTAVQIQKSSLIGRRTGTQRKQSQASKVRSTYYARLLSGVWHASRAGSATAPEAVLLISVEHPRRARFHRLAQMHRSNT